MPSTTITWTQSSGQTLCEFESLLGRRPIEVNGLLWRKVRTGFYRPLLQFKEYPLSITAPKLAVLGAVQHVVASRTGANSSISCLFFEKVSSYSADALDSNRKRQVRIASKQFVVAPVSDLKQFKMEGHQAYLSFHDRTGYDYGSQRRDPARFAAWAEGLFQLPQVLVLGAYQQDQLVGASVSYLVEQTVCYAAFFCTTPSLKLFLPDLMLHTVRSAAAGQPNVNRIFTGLYKGNPGLDRFYLLRGATCVRLPAVLRINPLLKPLLRYGVPKMYSKMLGEVEEEPGRQLIKQDART